jgi:hypothetical protein
MPADAEPWTVASELTSSDIVWLRQAAGTYVLPLLRGIADLYTSVLIERRRSAAQAGYVTIALFLLLLLAYMVIVYCPRIKTLHRERQRAQTLLLFLPPQLLATDGPSSEVASVIESVHRAGRL